ncbi:MAG TPA: NifB/NifX family molybdenum-iron cluster-binding protein [Syntrophorhabdales bacterium]|nr:NifB/NifX family molybdenum-iron cluster-binding protein [Syntrophorhabdales bacterium]
MKVCFAVQRDDGVESLVYGHFGSAPAFIVVDTEAADAAVTVNNRDLNHAHAACNPIQAIGGLKPDAVVVGGIGAGAINRLNAEGVRVYRAAAETVQQNLDLLKENKLPELSVQNACAGHAHGQGGCGH